MSSADDALSIKVLLVGLAGYPNYPGKDLPGAQGDLVLWLDLLTGLGVGPDQIWLATSTPAGPPTADSRELAAFAKTLKKGHGSTSGRLIGLRALIEGFVAGLSATDRALVVWAGHGYTAPNETLHFATSDTEPSCRLSDMMSWRGLNTVLDKRPADCELTMILDTCFAATGPGQRTLAEIRRLRPHLLERNRPTDVVFCASLGAQQARELTVHKRQVGAFSWAMTAVLARWGHAPDRAGWNITAEDLIGRTGAVLFSLGIVQNPVADGPVDEVARPILYQAADQQQNNTAPDELPGSEINPGNGGLVYELASGTSSLGQLVATTATAALGGVSAGRLWWSTVPAASFTLEVSTGSPPNLPLSGSLYASSAFSTTPQAGPTGTVEGWKLKSSGSVVGYAYKSGNDLVFLRVASTGLFGAGCSFTWSSTLTVPSGSYYKATDVPA